VPQPPGRPSPLVLALALAAGVAVLAAVAYVGVRLLVPDTPLQQAVGLLPDDTLRVSFTDWTQLSEQLDGAGITASSEPAAMEEFLERAFDEDLIATSSLADSFTALAAAYGVTPLDAEWEAYGQGRDGSVALLRLGDDVDLDDLRDRLEALGYEVPPGGASSEGTWVGSPELVAKQDPILTPLQQHLAVVEDQNLFVMSDRPEYVDVAVAAVTGDDPDLASVDGVTELVDIAGEPTDAEIWARDFACEDLAMAQADPSDRTRGQQLTEDAGGVHPLQGLVFAQQADHTLTVGMQFSDDDQASADLQPRTDLARGEAPGQGGSFSDRFTVADATAQGSTVTLTLDPREGRVLSDLQQGPVLFATC